MDEARRTWEQVLPLLEREITILSYDVWIKTLEPVTVKDSRLILAAASESGREFVVSRYYDLIKRAVNMANNLIVDIEIASKESAKETSAEDTYKESAYKENKTAEDVKTGDFLTVNPKYNFENFVVGKSNKLAYAAATAIAAEPGKVYNPLFIYGGAGLGKTHLMHAIGNYIRIANPGLKILFVTSEKFVNDLVAHIGTGGKSGGFREKYRGADVLMVDDIQFIAGKTATTEEIFHTFNELYDKNKQLVFTSDRFPKDIPDIDERLRSRFEWGFTADVSPPDLETRIAILRKKAQLQKYNVPMEVLSFMAECIDSNVREMEGLLNKVLMLSKLEESEPTVALVKEALRDCAKDNSAPLEPENIINAVCNLFNIKRGDLVGKKRTRDVVEPRQLCIYCMTEMLDLPLATIGNIFGGRDHTTVLYTRDRISEKLKKNVKTKTDIENIKNMALKK